jgi:hypothetical protein
VFFGAESFSVGNVDVYRPKPWPPTVTPNPKDPNPLVQLQRRRLQPTQLFDSADKPFLFWKTEAIPTRPAKDLKDVRKEVEHAWKVSKAREALLPRVKEVAQALEKAITNPKADLWTEVRDQATRLGTDPIKLQNVAPLVPKSEGENAPTQFVPYQLPHGTFSYPTAEMAKQLLSLRDLQKPLPTGHGDLDKLNQTLFEKAGKGGRVVQVLANRPRTAFYVVVQLDQPRPPEGEFFNAYIGALGEGAQRNLLLETAHGDYAREFRTQLIQQLRDRLDVRIDPDARKQYEEKAAKK